MSKVEFDVNRTFGIEIEVLSGNYTQRDIANAIMRKGVSAYYECYNHETKNHWKVITDASCGLEIVSPILKGFEGLNQIKLVCEALNEVGCKVNKSCGLHVHHGVNDFQLKHFQNLYKLYIKYEDGIDKVVPNSRRGNINHYCGSLIRYTKEYTIEKIMAAKTTNDIENFYGTRYVKLNIQSYVKYGTIEFRQHAGTTDADKMVNWVMFTQAMVTKSKTTTVTQKVIEGKTNLKDLFFIMNFNRKEMVTPEMKAVEKFLKGREKALVAA